MATVAYSEHFEFCEAYCERLYESLRVQIKRGPSDYAIQLASELASTRSRYAVWLSEESEAKLNPYEKARRELGAEMSAMKHRARPDRPNTVQQELGQRLVAPFLLLIGEKQPDSGEEAERSLIRGIENLRKL